MGKDGPFYAILLDKKPGGVESRNNLSLYYWEELEKMIKRSGIESVFDIAGDDEAGITKSFGIILRKDKRLFKRIEIREEDFYISYRSYRKHRSKIKRELSKHNFWDSWLGKNLGNAERAKNDK